jgi:WD40 repeat protein
VILVVAFVFLNNREAKALRSVAIPSYAWTASPQGDLLACSELGSTYTVNDAQSLQQIAEYNNRITSVTPKIFSNDGELLLLTGYEFNPKTSSGHQLYIWNFRSKQKPIIVPHDGGYLSFAFSPDSTCVVAVDERLTNDSKKPFTLGIWNTSTGERLKTISTGHQSKIQGLDWSADGSQIATASMDGTIRLTSVETGAELKCLTVKGMDIPWHMAKFAFDGKTVIGQNDKHLLTSWDIESGTVKLSHQLISSVVRYHKYNDKYDILSHSYSVPWIESAIKDNVTWLPPWALSWLEKRRNREDIYRFNTETGALSKVLSLPLGSKILATNPSKNELLAYQLKSNELDPMNGMLLWYSLQPSSLWVNSLAWSVGISISYLLLLLVINQKRHPVKPEPRG